MCVAYVHRRQPASRLYGSSSQASICGGSLFMMNAGVPLRCHVAGIAMGLIKEDDGVVILSDIQDIENLPSCCLPCSAA